MFVLEFILEKCSHIGLKVCEIVRKTLLFNMPKELHHLENFGRTYDPASSHVANCRVANCPDPTEKRSWARPLRPCSFDRR